jgi:hypothetical protein
MIIDGYRRFRRGSEVLLEDYEVEIVAEWAAEAFVAVREGSGFGGDGIASALVPGDQGVAEVDDCHFDAACAVLLGELFCGG